ncbi:MAG: hypothetical protein ACT4QG_11600 [Sporichthyaceae bacterium]
MGLRGTSNASADAPVSPLHRAIGFLRVGLLPALFTLLLAPWVGWLWEWLAPAPAYVNIDGSVFAADEDSSEFIAADVWFLCIGLGVGMSCGALAYWRHRRALPAMVAVTAAAFAAALIARETGEQFGPIDLAQAALGTVDGEKVNGAIEVRSNIALLGWPIGVLIAYVSMILGLEQPARKVDPEAELAQMQLVEAAEAAAGESGPGDGRQPGEDGAFARQQG